jgi:dihydropyrimidinase
MMTETASHGGECDLLVRGGLVVAAHGTGVMDIAISGELISGVGIGPWTARHTIDATNLVVLPGGVDAHTHLNRNWPFEDERRPADDFESGTKAALAGGITTVCDFTYTLGPESLGEAITRVQADAAAKSHSDFALHVAVTTLAGDVAAQVPEVIAAGFPSFKFYTQLDDYACKGAGYLHLLETIGASGGIAMFHCEDRALLQYGAAALYRSGRTPPRYYPAAKPSEVEIAATAQALCYATAAGVPAYIVHLSAGPALDQVLAARARGARVYAETRPLYLHLTASRFDADDADAALFIGTPPLRDEADRTRLWAALGSGEIDTVGSDHVGFTRAQKYRPGDTFETVPKGMSNMATMIAMLYSEGVLKNRLTLEQLAAVVAENPARIFGLYPRKGAIAAGSDADLCILDPALTRPVSARAAHSAADFDVYEGWQVTGWPVQTVLRGQVAYADGKVAAKPGSGRLVNGIAARQHTRTGR